MSILVGVGVHFGADAINRAKLEDIRTDMLSIKARAKIIADEKNFGDIEELKGTPVDTDVKSKLNIEEGYLWNRETLDEQGLNSIDADIYVVTYDLDNPNDSEVYYINGYDGAYSLTDLQNK